MANIGTYGSNPSYNYAQANPPAPGGPGIPEHLVRGGLAAAGGGLGALGVAYGAPQQLQLPDIQQLGQSLKDQGGAQKAFNTSNLPAYGPGQQQVNSTDKLATILERLTSQKVDQLTARRVMGSQPEALYNKAFNVSNNQIGESKPPQWGTGAQPTFSFDQYLGGGKAQFSPLSALGDLAFQGAQAEAPEPGDPWWRTGAHGLGTLLQAAAPLGGAFGPYGALAGLAAGGLGYGLQQI